MEIFSLATHGFGFQDTATALLRIAVGLFFAISGYHKLFNRARHARLLETLLHDHVPFARFNQWWVPFWELTAGALLTVGVLTVFSAGVLLIVMLIACVCEAPKTVASYGPIDVCDVVDDYLYLPEVLYLLVLASIVFSGPGQYSIDAIIWRI